MGGWNRSRGRRGRSGGVAASRPSLPPPPPPHGDNHRPVPLWEREFCCYVGNISWEKFCENKQFAQPFFIEPWDDSGAFDNFLNVKARFRANYHGQPSDIPLLDPDLCIDKVNDQCEVDPELLAELDSLGLPCDADDYSSPATGCANAGADNKCTKNGSGNWDLEKPPEVNKWDSEVNPAPDAAWGGQANPPPEAVWGDQSTKKWGNNSNTGLGAPLEKPSWRGWSKNQYAPNSWNNNFHARSSNSRYQQQEDLTSGAGRKQNGAGGGHFKQRSNTQRNQDEEQHQQQRSGGWQQDHRGRNRQWRPVHNRAPQNDLCS